MEPTKQKLREILVKALRLKIPAEQVGETNLVSTLGIDSINSLEVLIWVEDEFGITIQDEDLSPRLLDSLDTLASYVETHRGSPAAAGTGAS